MIKRVNIQIYFSIFLLLLSNTLGFDGYWHAIAISSINDQASSSFWVIEGFAFPRYLLFHYIFYTISIFGLIPFFPLLIVVNAIAFREIYIYLPDNRIAIYAIIFGFIYFALFSSALGLSFNLLLAGIFVRNEKKSLFLSTAGLMHPVGFLVVLIFLIYSRYWSIVFINLSIILIVIIVSTSMINHSNIGVREIIISDEVSIIGNSLTSPFLDMIYGKFQSEGFYLFSILIFLKYIRLLRPFLILVPKFRSLYFILFCLFILFYSIPAQIKTGGPLVLPWLLIEQPFSVNINAGKINLLLGSWISPLLFNYSDPFNTFEYRESMN